MPRRQVALGAGECYHLYNRGNNRGRVFFERENYLFFLRRLREHLLPALDVIAYCLMPTHYHLLVHVKAATSADADDAAGAAVSKGMMRLTVSYTKAINKRYERVGALFQGAFQARHVGENNHLLHLSRYIHLNPVEAGLVSRAEAWEFSSYREYIGLRKGTLPQMGVVLAQFASQDQDLRGYQNLGGRASEAYRAFAEAYVDGDQARITHLMLD